MPARTGPPKGGHAGEGCRGTCTHICLRGAREVHLGGGVDAPHRHALVSVRAHTSAAMCAQGRVYNTRLCSTCVSCIMLVASHPLDGVACSVLYPQATLIPAVQSHPLT